MNVWLKYVMAYLEWNILYTKQNYMYKTKLEHFFSQNVCPPPPEILTGIKHTRSSSVRVGKYAPRHDKTSRPQSDDHQIFIFARKHATAVIARSPRFFTLSLTHVVMNGKIEFFPSSLTQRGTCQKSKWVIRAS